MIYRLAQRTEHMSPDGRQRLKVWVAEHEEDRDPAVFVWQRVPTPPEYQFGTPVMDRFVSVASLADMEEYPVDEPFGDCPMFRRTWLDIEFKSPRLLRRTWLAVRSDVAALERDVLDVENPDMFEEIEVEI